MKRMEHKRSAPVLASILTLGIAMGLNSASSYATEDTRGGMTNQGIESSGAHASDPSLQDRTHRLSNKRYKPPSIERLAGLVRAIQASVARNPPGGGVAPPPEAPDETSPSTILYQVIAELEAYLESREQGSLKGAAERHVDRSRAAILEFIAQYGTSPRPAIALKSLGKAAASLRAAKLKQHDRADETIDRAQLGVAQAARGVAVRLLDVAVSAGVPQTVLEAAQRRLVAGDRAVANGQFGVAIAQFGGAGSISTSPLSFDIARFEQNIRDKLDGNTIGHAYSIGLGGQLYNADFQGDARTTTDDETDQSPFKEMYTASISKTLSAVGLLKALDSAGISVDSFIGPYLPDSWTQGQNVAILTFRHLLTHTSGLPSLDGPLGGQSLDTLRDVIAAGTEGTLPFNSADYTNANFGLMRILIPQITTGADLIAIYSNVLPEDHVYAALYADYISGEVLSPAAVNAPLCAPAEAASARTLGYLFPSPNSSGIDFGDWSLGCGATGWNLSAVELGSFMAFLRYTNDIVDFDTRALMDGGFLGWLNPVTFAGLIAGDFGDYRGHGGDSHAGAVRGMTGCAMKFPTAVEATLLINSRGNNISGHSCTVLRDAYDEAWTAP